MARTRGCPTDEAIRTLEQLQRAYQLRVPILDSLHLEGAHLHDARLEGACLDGVHLEGANLGFAKLGGPASLRVAHLEGALLYSANLTGALLQGAYLQGASLDGATLYFANLTQAHLEGASLVGAHVESASLTEARLDGANLRLLVLDQATDLSDSSLGDAQRGYVSLADVRWSDANLAVVDWTRTTRGLLGIRTSIEAIELGDEREARKAKDEYGEPKYKAKRLQEYKIAVRANRQLATVLRSQGLNEDADRFAYKAQKLQRQVLRRQRRYGAALGSWFLDVIAGYGYKPMRSLIAYVLIICAFAGAYLVNAQFAAPHLSWDEALVLSISAFHGRGFFTSGISLGDTLARLAAGEAIIGLLIEITFIATFTQRFFAR